MIKRTSAYQKGKCRFCRSGQEIDYKDVETLKKLVTPHGKIQSRRMTGTCALHHRRVTNEVKKSRIMAILPFAGSSNGSM